MRGGEDWAGRITGDLIVALGFYTRLPFQHDRANFEEELASASWAAPIAGVVVGAIGALTYALAHAAGPIIAMCFLPLRLDRQLFVGACAIYFFIVNTAKLPAYYASGAFTHAELSSTAKFLPLVLVGAVFGRWLNKRMSDKLVTKIVDISTFVLGWYILADGILNLFGKHIA